jgi:threonine/homoserine/homoserine lactone efflux protein
MHIDILLHGIVIGFFMATPVGPIAMLIIRRTLINGRISGIASGLGGALADACYGGVAALGLKIILDELILYQVWLRLGGGIFLIILGIRTYLTRKQLATQRPKLPQDTSIHHTVRALLSDCSSTFFLTLTNPLSILAFAAVFAGVGVHAGLTWGGFILTGGVFAGSALWWLCLSFLVNVLHKRFLKPAGMQLLTTISGIAIAVFGFGMFASALPNLLFH